jgi:Kef-type K+ transport system membrane component KefB
MEITMSDRTNIDEIRSVTMDQIERAHRNGVLALCAAAVFEAFFLAALLLGMDLNDKIHRLLLISTVGGYTVVVFGLIVLGAWLNRGMLRNIKAFELMKDEIIAELRKRS